MSENIDKLLPAVYESQRDNIMDGSVTCAVTTLSMLIQSHAMQPGETRAAQHTEDAILTDLKKRFPESHKTLREDFNFLTRYAKTQYGIDLVYKAMNKNDWIAKAVNSDAPFMTSTSNALTSFGHIVLIRGMKADETGVFLYVNDPYGCHPYIDKKRSGEAVLYSADLFPFDDGHGKEKKYHTLSYG